MRLKSHFHSGHTSTEARVPNSDMPEPHRACSRKDKLLPREIAFKTLRPPNRRARQTELRPLPRRVEWPILAEDPKQTASSTKELSPTDIRPHTICLSSAKTTILEKDYASMTTDSRSFTTSNQISGCTHAPCRIHTDATFPVSKFKEEKPFAQSLPNHNCHDK